MRFWIPLLFLALVLRLGAAVYWQERMCGEKPFYFGDSETYWELGRTIAQGKPYEFSEYRWQMFRTPGYPALLAPLFCVFGDNPPVYAARFFGAILGTATVAAVGWLGFLLFHNRNAARFAAVVVACDPCQILASILVLSESPFCLLMVLQIAFWIKGRESLDLRSLVRNFTLCGLFYAAAVYCRPSWLYFVPFGLVFECWEMLRRGGAEYRLKGCIGYGVILLVFLLTMVPWWARNYQLCGRFVATSLQMGPSLYDGLNPLADGSSRMDFVDRFREEEPTDPRNTYEYRVDQRMKQAAIHWAWQNPGRVLELAGIKFVRFWNFWPNEPSFSSLPIRVMIFATYVPVLVCAIGGILTTWKRGFSFWLCWIPAVYFTALHLIFVSSLRYRIPPMLLLTVLAAGFLFRTRNGQNRS